MVEVTEIQDMQHLKSVKEWPQHMMILMLHSHTLADHVYIKEHRYIYLQGHKKGNKSSLFCNYLFFSFAQNHPLSKERASSLKNHPLSKGRAVLSQEPPSFKRKSSPSPIIQNKNKGRGTRTIYRAKLPHIFSKLRLQLLP